MAERKMTTKGDVTFGDAINAFLKGRADQLDEAATAKPLGFRMTVSNPWFDGQKLTRPKASKSVAVRDGCACSAQEVSKSAEKLIVADATLRISRVTSFEKRTARVGQAGASFDTYHGSRWRPAIRML